MPRVPWLSIPAIILCLTAGSDAEAYTGDLGPTPVRSRLVCDSTCPVPFLLDSMGAHLRWPFPSGSWQQRNQWLGAGEPGGIGNSWGENGHQGSDYYAVDWNKVSPEDDCDSAFYAPLGGTVIYVRSNCPHTCIGDAYCGGNQVVIQSNVDTSYAFSVLHLNSVNVYPGKIVQPGDLIGNIGATGLANGSHAHCSLYRNANRYFFGTNQSDDGKAEHANRFDFSATCGGTGPNNIDLNPVTGLPDIAQDGRFRIWPNPARNQLYISAPPGSGAQFSFSLYTTDGTLVFATESRQSVVIDVSGFAKGCYLLLLRAGNDNYSKLVLVGW